MITSDPPTKRLRTKAKPSNQSLASHAVAGAHDACSSVAAVAGGDVDSSRSRASSTLGANPAKPAGAGVGSSAEVASTSTAGMLAASTRSTRSASVTTPVRVLSASQRQLELRASCAILRLSQACAPLASVSIVFLDKDSITFGSVPPCDVVLHSELSPGMISRKHCFVQRIMDECGTAAWLMCDAGSLNGMVINGDRLHPNARHVLRHGDCVTFGRQRDPPVFEFYFELPSGATPEKDRQASASTDAIGTRVRSAAVAQPQLESCSNVVALLRLSPACPPLASAALVPLDRETVSFGRIPSCDVVLDSELVPGMISRRHGVVRKIVGETGDTQWLLCDMGSMNGIIVNGARLASNERRVLRAGDCVTFGRQIATPVFEFTFELHSIAAPDKEGQAKLDVAEIHSELACCICRDWMVHAATLECSHSFCWSCVDHWLLEKQFWCPVCRSEVTRDPLRTRAMDAIVEKTVRLLPQSQQADYAKRVEAADTAVERARLRHAELQDHANASFHISANWKRKDREAFHKGVQDYTGDAHEKYCGLHGLTVHFAHSADESALNQALHNLQLAKFVDCSEEQIRRRLLLFMRYG